MNAAQRSKRARVLQIGADNDMDDEDEDEEDDDHSDVPTVEQIVRDMDNQGLGFEPQAQYHHESEVYESPQSNIPAAQMQQIPCETQVIFKLGAKCAERGYMFHKSKQFFYYW
jgi:hypothetical protein